MELLTSLDAWIALITLTVLEVVLGIDNIVFISLLSSKLEQGQQARARTLGLSMAMLIASMPKISVRMRQSMAL